MRRVLFAVIMLTVFAGTKGSACEPCPEVLSFKETVRRADLIIEGQKAGSGPMVGLAISPDSADWIEVKVLKVLKGKEENELIRVNSWNGMCGYGIVIDDRNYVMFLSRIKGDPVDFVEYDAVDYGCSVKTYLVEDGLILLDKEKITVSDFMDKVKNVLEKKGP